MRVLLGFVFSLYCSAQGIPMLANGMVHAAAGGGGTWSITQHKVLNSPSCDGGTSCSLTVTSTGTGHALIFFGLGYNNNNNVLTYSSTSGACASYGHNAASDASRTYLANNTVSSIGAYCTSSTSGVTSVTITSSVLAVNWSAEFIEAAWSGSTIAFDAAGATAITSNCSSCTGQALTLGGSSDLICQAINTSTDTPSAISGGAGYTAFTIDVDATYASSGYACAINTTNGGAPTWTITSGQGVVSAIALKGS